MPHSITNYCNEKKYAKSKLQQNKSIIRIKMLDKRSHLAMLLIVRKVKLYKLN